MNNTTEFMQFEDVFYWGVSFNQTIWIDTGLPEIAKIIFYIIFWVITIFLTIPSITSTLFLSTMYVAALLVKLCELRRKFRGGYGRIEQDEEWRVIKRFYEIVSKVWHGYEIHGFENNIPYGKPFVFVTYHGTACVDGIYLSAIIARRLGTPCYTIAHKATLEVRGLKRLQEVMNMCVLSREECVKLLQEGTSLAIAPGGIREAQRADQKYQVYWPGKTGFAKIALDAKVPIIPHFLRNVNETYWIPWILIPFVRGRWAPKKIKCIPGVGALPVKLDSFVGEPIYPDEGMDEVAFAEKVAKVMQELIYKTQRIPGSRIIGLWERIWGITLPGRNKKRSDIDEIV